MGQVVIENPILNSPFTEPTKHFKFSDEGITNEIINARRTSSYFIPVAQPKKSGFGRWAFMEIDDPWNAQNAIRKGISTC